MTISAVISRLQVSDSLSEELKVSIYNLKVIRTDQCILDTAYAHIEAKVSEEFTFCIVDGS